MSPAIIITVADYALWCREHCKNHGNGGPEHRCGDASAEADRFAFCGSHMVSVLFIDWPLIVEDEAVIAWFAERSA